MEVSCFSTSETGRSDGSDLSWQHYNSILPVVYTVPDVSVADGGKCLASMLCSDNMSERSEAKGTLYNRDIYCHQQESFLW